MEVKPRIQRLLDDLNKGVYEKNEVIALALLTAIAGESIFLLGPPGVAKSLIARRLKFAFNDGTSFEYLMNRFSTPDEIFGPVSISKLRDENKYERIIKNYLPSATVVFLDEIWKAGPSIQNSLLTVLNEKIYRNGEQEVTVPMKALISASNELPMKGEGLEALWDRFLIRYSVGGITDRNLFNEMISKSLKSYEDNIDANFKINDSEYDIWSGLIEEIEIPENVFIVIHIIRSYIQEYNLKEEHKENQIYISDRRWKKVVRLLRTCAFLNDRTTVDLMDCFLIAHCIWNEPTQFQSVLQFTKDAIQKHGYTLTLRLSDLQEKLKDLNDEVIMETSYIKEISVTELAIVEKDFYGIIGFGQNARITITNYDKLDTKIEINIYLNIYEYNYYREKGSYRVRKGKQNHIIINDSVYALQTASRKDKKKATKKPHHATKIFWDKEVAKFLTTTSNLNSQIDHYKANDLKHIRVNLFVDASLAKIVENNLNNLESEIGKLEVEVKRIQYYYEHIEEQTKQKEIKLLSIDEHYE